MKPRPEDIPDKLIQAMMSCCDIGFEDKEYQNTLWMKVLELLRKYKLTITYVQLRPYQPHPDPQKAIEDPADDGVLMPFGKYKGIPVSRVPGDYLRYLAGKGAVINNLEVRAAIEKRLEQPERPVVAPRRGGEVPW